MENTAALARGSSECFCTKYDAATANWGAPWRMPTLEQCKELIKKCSYEWTTQNGVKGGKFTGPNGGTVFLPAAGYRWNGEFFDVGSWGYYWSSTPSDEYHGYNLYFLSGHAYWSYDYRGDGLTVRPVR